MNVIAETCPCFYLGSLWKQTLLFQTRHEREYKRSQGQGSPPRPLSISNIHQVQRERLWAFLNLVPLPSSLFLSVCQTKESGTLTSFLCTSLSLSLSLRTFHLSVLQSLTGETYASASAVTGYPAVGRPPAASVTSARAAQPALLSSLTFHAVADISILDDPCEVGCCS